MKTNFSGTILVSNVWSGAIGGAIFTGKNIENNFNVKCRADYKIITRTPEKGEFWKISGEIIKTKEYGDMIIVKKCNLVALPSVKYLSSLLIKHPVFRKIGLGPSKVNNLLKNIGGEELIRLMNTGNATHIADFIAKPIAEALCERWNPLNNEMQLASFFMDNNIDPYLTKKIIKVCRFNTLERIKKNPYGLLAFGAITKNFWNSIDQTAQKLGFTKDSKERKIGAVEQILYDLLRQGDTAITQSKLENLLIKLLGKKEHCKGAILEASKVKAICFFRRSNVTYVQSVGAATIEANLEKNILNLQSKEFVNNISKTQLNTSIDAYCHKNVIEQGYPITEEQKSAVRMSLTEHISIITGFGGTGKTTVLKAIVDIAEIGNRRVYILALAGKAKERAKEAVKRDNIAFTIHRFIKILQESRDELDLNDPIIIIDEASMVDIVLANRLMSQLKAINFSLVLVGDPAQLSPVGIGLFFHECVNKLPTVHLTKVHRQSDHSKIHQIAMKFRCGEVSKIPSWNNEREGVFFIDSGSTQRELIRTLSHVTTEYKMQIITPHAS
jgi:exodeoxyribonuclease V alpha subunit